MFFLYFITRYQVFGSKADLMKSRWEPISGYIDLALFQFICFKSICFKIRWPEESFEKKPNLNLMNVGYFGVI